MRTIPLRSSRSGFTLVEMLVAVVVLALMFAIAIPRSERLFSHSAVKSARAEVAGKFRLAQLTSTLGGRTAIVRVSSGRIWVEARPRTVAAMSSISDTLGGVSDLRLVHNVAISRALDSVVYTPQGLAATGGVVVLHRSGITDSVVVNALGLVTQ